MVGSSSLVFLAVACVFGIECQHTKHDPFLYGKFPDGFMWGTATASYQVEGAWNVSGKGENIWDKFTHAGGHVKNNDTGDVACDSYNKYKDDIKLMKDMGVSHYRFSISWTRIFPDGTSTSYNADGMQYYKNLTAELNANNITPMATLYHWDLPQMLEDNGGWLNDSIVDKFNDYADKVFEQLGDNVKLWLTFNEPWVVCWVGYGVGAHAPGKKDQPGVDPYKCAHNIIKSHAKAWRTYDTKYRAAQNGSVSITLNSDWKEPKTNSTADIAAAERAQQFMLGWFAHPIYVNGDYPDVMKEYVKNMSDAQGLSPSRLPEFSAAEKTEINGTFDFFGLNHYTTQLISDRAFNASIISYEQDVNVYSTTDPTWTGSGSVWLFSVPWGLRNMLRWIKKEYGNPPLYITENGVSDHNGTLQDQHRIDFYNAYINNVLKAIKKDGCNVKGYTAWSLLDNFEWAEGYTEKFGMHYVDFNDPARPRSVKDSAKWFKSLISENGFTEPTTSTTVTTQKPSDKTTSSASVTISSALLIAFIVIAQNLQ